jgi:hypothetical protein
VRVYKFLEHGATGPFSRFAWPMPADGAPGAWVIAEPPLATCRSGIHACRVRDLPWWLSDELWEAELVGPVALGAHKATAARGRLVARVPDWTPKAAAELGDACAWRTRDIAVVGLRRQGAEGAAERLAACAELADVEALGYELAAGAGDPRTRVALTMAADGAVRARIGPVATVAYIAAQAAGRLLEPSAMDRERAWQAEWMRARLGLAADA